MLRLYNAPTWAAHGERGRVPIFDYLKRLGSDSYSERAAFASPSTRRGSGRPRRQQNWHREEGRLLGLQLEDINWPRLPARA